MTPESLFSTTVTVTDRASMDRQLDSAVASVLGKALSHKRHGILVTRHAVDKFTVSLSNSVPFGQTMERHDW